MIKKEDHPPIWPIGRHEVSIEELRVACVDSQSQSATRGLIFPGVSTILKELQDFGVPCEIWVDGSFATKKRDPEDADIVVVFDGDLIDRSRVSIQDVRRKMFLLRFIQGCHVFDTYLYPKSHPLYWEGHYNYIYWMNKWGRGHDERNAKGIPVIKVCGGIEVHV